MTAPSSSALRSRRASAPITFSASGDGNSHVSTTSSDGFCDNAQQRQARQYPPSRRSTRAKASDSNLNNNSRDDATGKSRRPSTALAWYSILLLTVSTIVIMMMGKRGIRRGISVATHVINTYSGGGGGSHRDGARGGTIRGTGRGDVSTAEEDIVKSTVDEALINAAHVQRKDRVDAALNVASATSAYRSSSNEPVDDPSNLADHLGSRLHVVFSTDCGTFQHWQSYLLFYSALRVGQPGRVSRIASGCKDGEEREASEWFDAHVRPMSSRFGIHFTPHFSTVKDEKTGEEKGNYKFFNKPFGLRHWLENGDGMGVDKDTGRMKDEDVVVILIDPDMLFLRPITSDYSVDRDIVLGRLPAEDAKKGNQYRKVEKGKPFGQTYGFGNQWRKNVDISIIVGDDSPAIKAKDEFARLHYPVGPPYLAVASDMHTIAVGWTDFVPKVHQQYPNLLAEMFGYCLSAAHNELPHQRLDSLMVSAVDMNGGEGWELVDSIPDDEVCGFAAHPDHNKYAVPNVVHFCQRYGTGPYFFAKRRVPHDIFTCESPLMVPPPPDSALKYDFRVNPDGTHQSFTAVRRKREAFAACAVIHATNEAASYFKRHHCSDDANWDARLSGNDKGMTQAEVDAEQEELKQRNLLKSETR
mmetsp:Transcript_18234/g.39456  ORF Transcript_18234/g.39456 Transcript_18234/m.39456 type:complete len:642 (+) Transcript_18234:3-1928(+)